MHRFFVLPPATKPRFSDTYDTGWWRPGYVYYARLQVGRRIFYKIGSTVDLRGRYKAKQRENLTLLATWEHASAKLAKAHEHSILRENKARLYRGKSLAKAMGKGAGELFSFDIFGLDHWRESEYSPAWS